MTKSPACLAPVLTLALAWASASVGSGCGDLEAEGEPSLDGGGQSGLIDAGGDGAGDAGSGPALGVVVQKQVDTTSADVWVYLDLESGETRPSATAPDWPAWDLKLQRFKLAVNGGASGAGRVQVAVLGMTDFATVSRAPRETYAADGPDGADSDLDPDTVLSNGDMGWYEYNSMTHALSARPNVYVVRTNEGAFFKLAIDSYYNAAGSSGYLQLRWAAVAQPEGTIVSRDPVAPDAGVDATTSASKP